MKVFEASRGRAAVWPGLPIAALAITSCATATEEEIVTGLSPIERLDYEYAGRRVYAEGNTYVSGNECLKNTAYDPVTNRSSADFEISTSEDGNVIVTLFAAGGVGEIALKGFENLSKPLKPADEDSQAKMAALGC